MRHPGERDLNRFADGALDDREHARVSAHLADCPRCREEVALVRRIADSARTIPTPLATDEVLRRALARRAAGERVLLPMNDAGAPRPERPWRFAPAAIAAMLTLMVASLVVSVRVLEADRPALRVYPERPAAGEALTVEYHGGALFADQTHLALRARYRTAADRHWQLLAGVLTRGDDGLYRTEVQLPDSVVYAAFAVEDLHGQRLDSNNRELWDVMVHGEDGRPSLDAMYARVRDLEGRDWGEAYETARAMTAAYADAPQSWMTRFSYELSLFDRDSIFGAHREQFARLEKAMAGRSQQDGEAMAWLGVYALDLGSMDSAELWIRRAVATSDAPAAGDAYALLVSVLDASDPAARVDEMEALWGRYRSRSIAHVAWQAAIAAQDQEAVLRWADRYSRERPGERLTLIPAAYAAGGLRPRLVREVRDFLASPAPGGETARPLHMPSDDHVRAQARLFQRALSEGAVLAAEAEDTVHARSLAELGLDLAWESEALLRIAHTLWIAGDRTRALQALVRAEADPETADSAAAAEWAPPRGTAWPTRLARARQDLREYLMAGGVIRYLEADPRLQQDGSIVRFSSLHAGQPTVVSFFSRYCAPALDDAERLPALAAALEEVGARLIVVDVDNTGTLEPYLEALGYHGPVYRDHRGEARSVFHSTNTADFFVVDASGRVRFEHSSPGEILRQVWAISPPSDASSVIAD